MTISVKNVLNPQNRALLRELVLTDFKLRYQGSVLGYLWSLLKPLMLFAVLYAVFTRFLRFGGDPQSLLLGIVLWTFFVEATASSLPAIVDRGDLIRKIYIPKFLIIMATTMSAFINLLLNLVVVSAFVLIWGEGFSISWLVLPILLLELVAFTVAVSFFLSALYVRFRDINYIWEVTTQLLFFMTPILYPLTLITNETVRQILMLNPLAQIIQDARAYLTEASAVQAYDLLDNFLWLIPFGLIAVAVYTSAVFFRYESRDFAENV